MLLGSAELRSGLNVRLVQGGSRLRVPGWSLWFLFEGWLQLEEHEGQYKWQKLD